MPKFILSFFLSAALLLSFGCCSVGNDYIGSYVKNDQRTEFSIAEMNSNKQIKQVMDITKSLYNRYFPAEEYAEYPDDMILVLARGEYGNWMVAAFRSMGITRGDGKMIVVERPAEWKAIMVISHELVHELQRSNGILPSNAEERRALSSFDNLVIEYQAEVVSNRVWHYLETEGAK